MTEGATRRGTLARLAGLGVPLAMTPGDTAARNGQETARSAVAAPFVRTGNALDKLRDIGSSVRDSGASGNGRDDDTQALQEIADHFARVGGKWFFPAGVFRTTAPIVIDCGRPQHIRGQGRRGVYPGRFEPEIANGLAVIMPVHSGRAAVQFAGARNSSSVTFEDMALATLEIGSMPTAAFGWDAASGFLRDFQFLGCSVHGFTSAFDLFSSGRTGSEMGLFKAHRCTINRNQWIARSLDATQWNGFSFRDNEAGQNGYQNGQGGLAVSAHNVEIAGNCLEGQRDPVHLTGGMRGASIRDNYFEANIGDAAIHLQDLRGPFDVGPNAFLEIDHGKLGQLVRLSNCGHGRVLGPYWANGVHKMSLPVIGASALGDNMLNPTTNAGPDTVLRFDGFDSAANYLREPRHSTMARGRLVADGQERAPWDGQPLPVARHDTSSGTALAFDYALEGKSGDWAVVSWLFRRDTVSDSAHDPYFSLLVNGSAGDGSQDFVGYNFSEYWRAGEWCLVTAATRLRTASRRLAINLYPYGLHPNRRGLTRYTCPIAYMTTTPNDITPYIE